MANPASDELPSPPLLRPDAPLGVGDRPAAAPPLWLTILRAVAGFGILAIALLAIHNALDDIGIRQIRDVLHHVSGGALILALIALAASYACYAQFDSIAFRAIGARIDYATAAVGSALAFSISGAVGFGAFAGGGLRFRLYGGAAGPNGAEIARVGAMASISNVLGGVVLAAAGCLAAPSAVAAAFHVPETMAPIAGAALFLGLVGYAVLSARRFAGGLSLAIPPLRFLPSQIALSTMEWIAAATILYVFLPPESRGSFLAFAPIFAAAGLAGALSGLPGGLGAFDAVFLLLATGPANALALPQEGAAALILFRGIYQVTPLFVSLMGVAALEAPRRASKTPPQIVAIGRLAHAAAPLFFAAAVFVFGALTLALAARPTLAEKMSAIQHLAPLGAIEASHFLASIVGVGLLVVADGLRRRLDVAYWAALLLLLAAAIFSLVREVNLIHAATSLGLAILLAPTRGAFDRHAALSGLRPRPAALLMAAGVLIAAGWLGLFSYRYVEYRDELWWTFVARGEASRFLRGAAGASATLFLFGLLTLMRRKAPALPPPTGADLEKAAEAMRTATLGHADSNLAFLGDKHLLFSPSGRSFIQFGVRGRSWIAMGGPNGDPKEAHDLIWSFREAADAHEAHGIFYSVWPDQLPLMLDAGLSPEKCGENALVDLADFSLEGAKRARLRQGHARSVRDGLTFEIIPPEGFDAHEPALRAISDSWLAGHTGGEKRFSLGRFDPAYLRRFPIALVHAGGAPIAFANLWITADKREISVDLMRRMPGDVKGVMEFLFIETMLWGKAQGYGVFDLGMAPLSGLEGRRLASMTMRIGAFVYQTGEKIYGFEGLQAFKNKFGPRWQPLYLAAPSGLIASVALADVALLTSGGISGLLFKR